MSVRHEIVGHTRDRLGECPLWDARDQSLYWIDIKARLVRRLRRGQYHEWATPSEVGSIALTESGRIALALEDGFHLLDLGSSNGVYVLGQKVEDAIIREGDVFSLGDAFVRLLPEDMPATLAMPKKGPEAAQAPRPAGPGRGGGRSGCAPR